MINVKLVGLVDLHREALAAAVEEPGAIECQLLPLKEVMAAGAAKPVTFEKVVVLLYFADEQSRNGTLFPRVRRLFPQCRTIFLTEAADAELGTELFRRGAWGVFPQSGHLANLRKAIRAVAADEIWADRHCSSQVIRKIVEGKRSLERSVEATPDLSTREKQILSLVAGGMKNGQVAEKLQISEMTVKVHLNRVFKKIGVKNRLQAALFALHNNITPAKISID
jgi:DNA-binding NarL/FixJ family response regulator